MIDAILAKVFGAKNKREIKPFSPSPQASTTSSRTSSSSPISTWPPKPSSSRKKLAQGAPLDDLLVEAFAVVREAGRRFLNMRHFDVQLIGGIVLRAE